MIVSSSRRVTKRYTKIECKYLHTFGCVKRFEFSHVMDTAL